MGAHSLTRIPSLPAQVRRRAGLLSSHVNAQRPEPGSDLPGQRNVPVHGLGAAALPRGTGAASTTPPDRPSSASAARLPPGHRDRRSARQHLPLPPGRPASASRSRLAIPAAGSSRPLPGGRSRFRLARPGLERRSRSPRPGHLRAAPGDIHPGGDPGRHHRPPRRVEGAGRHRSGTDAAGPVPGQPQLGLRRRQSLCRPEQLWRTVGPETTGRCLPLGAAWRSCSTWSTTISDPRATT